MELLIYINLKLLMKHNNNVKKHTKLTTRNLFKSYTLLKPISLDKLLAYIVPNNITVINEINSNQEYVFVFNEILQPVLQKYILLNTPTQL